MSAINASNGVAAGQPLWRAYWELTKPRVVMLLMVTAVVGMFLATPGAVPATVLILGSLGMALAMMASATVNQVMDQRAPIAARWCRGRSAPLPPCGLRWRWR